jgi:hypothetical protein
MSVDALVAAVDDPDVTCIKLAPIVYALSATLYIGKGRTLGITADGGQATLDGGGSVQLIRSQGDVALANLVLSNGYSIYKCDTCGGGAIRNGGTMAIYDSELRGNKAPGGYGGAILNIEGTMALHDSILIENEADGGGAICNDMAKMEMQRCALTSNRAFTDGGAIFNEWSDTTMMTCNLTSNEAIDSGGAVYEVFGTAQMDFCRFVGNVATVGWAFSSAEHRGPVAIRNSFFFFDFDNAPCSILKQLRISFLPAWTSTMAPATLARLPARRANLFSSTVNPSLLAAPSGALKARSAPVARPKHSKT